MLELKPILNALRRSKVGAILLLIQIAITTAIVSNAAFIIQDRLSYLQQETGYPEQDIFSLTILTFGKDRDLSQQFEEDEAMIRALPGVVDASLTNAVPLSGSGSATGIGLQPEPEPVRNIRTGYLSGDEHMLTTLGVEVSEGRNFYPDEVVVTQDRTKVPNVAIASKAFLEEAYPDESGLGKVMYMGDRPFKIIGIVDSMKGPWLKDSRPDNVVIFPYTRAETYQKIMVRTEPGQRDAVMRIIEEKMLDAYDKRVISNVIALDENKRQYNASDTLMMRMLIVLIVVLVGVTALGIFGLTLFNISKRTRQIGTRRALGARKSDIIRYFLVENAVICLGGLLVGCIGAIAMGQQLLAQFSLPALDMWYVAGTAIMVLAMTLLAVISPARRAARISPSVATRSI
ncbi:ABC transporter permease [Alteromonas gilva]|uniref:ABC transporter permease n=1 Tax=Alteromonas gilva TaxID=2987522 RepID=A0ABT5L536_9ALTE|nr:FtsX-like permease family protein [Alteromonas gilva]MDC8832156.1 ABC transporter permease [Alteromonas gilva]